ncbi:MAG: hypothetical protein JXR94_16995 [Candidatus Hydrogenedentes bacterium]|nr:hypothetical protein [Candidatus Hydrogenedentota bacterium]
MSAQTENRLRLVEEPTHDERSPEVARDLPATLRKVFLRSLIGSLIVSAAMGIYAFLQGRWGQTEARILFTTLSVSFCSMTALASAAAYSRGRKFPLAYGLSIAGVGASIIAFLLFMGGIWSFKDFNESYAKAMAIAGIVSFSLGHASVLGLASLPGRLRRVYWLTLCAIASLAAVSTALILFELEGEIYFRVLGIIGILDGCGTLTTPILAKLHGLSSVQACNPEAADEITLFCPQCGSRKAYPLGDITCATCGLKLRVEVVKEDDTQAG